MRSGQLTLTPAFWSPRPRQELGAVLARWFDDFEQRRRRRRQYEELRRVHPGTLRDIGLDRSELMSVTYGGSAGRARRGPAE
jgi:uncharacterized protein YjiS (DUF1127 family)